MSRSVLRRRDAWAAAVLSVTLLSPAAGRAGEEPIEGFGPVALGSRVRLQAPSVIKGRVEGVVLQVDDDVMVVSGAYGTPLRVPREAVTKLEVSTGRRSRALKGMAIGAAVGGAALAIVDQEQYCADYYATSGSCPGRAAMVGEGMVGGAVWGLVIGHFVKTDRWSSVSPRGPHVRVAPARSRQGYGMAVSVGW